jgi:hypothetical protein
MGYVLVTNHNGSVVLSGALADGSAWSQQAPMGVWGEVPVFSDKLYNGTGLLVGWLGLSNGTVQAQTPLAWVKPGAKTGIYTNGFTNYLLPSGSGWTPGGSGSLSNGWLVISNAVLDLDFAISITNGIVSKDPSATTNPTNSLSGSIAPKTGLLSVTFGSGAGKGTLTGYGALLPDWAGGGGYFVTQTNAGLILLTNSPP